MAAKTVARAAEESAYTDSEEFKNYIGGEWVKSAKERTFEQRNPASLSEITGIFQASTEEDTRNAIAIAEKAFPSWRGTSPPDRAEILKRARNHMVARTEELAKVLTLENGKTLAESRIEINAAIKEIEFQIGEGLRIYGETVPTSQEGVFAYSVREPLGIVGVISPWNFPFNVPSRKCTPALLAGNTVVFKPASLTPQTGLRFAQLFIDAGLPPGVLNLVTGSGKDVGDVIVSDPRVKAVSFTGSTDVGRRIQQRAALNLTQTQLELGGKNPTVVLEDADMEAAVSATVLAAYACAGQWCTSTSRAIVVKEALKEFTERVVEKAESLRVGNGQDPAVAMGPVCGPAQLKTILAYIEKGKEEGAKLLTGGNRLTGPDFDDGCFIEPTVFGNVTSNMTIAQEEIFGPVLSIMAVKDFDEAVEVANDIRFGLSSSIYTHDLRRALTFLEKTEVGLAHVNLPSALKEPQLSFGGIKESGSGIPEGGKAGIEFFTKHKVAYVKYR